MLFPSRFWPGLADGSVTVAFRRWRRPSVRAGGTLQTRAGLLAIDEVVPIDPADVTDEDARAAGHTDRHAALAVLRPEGTLYRVRFHRLGDDPRVERRERTELDADEWARLSRFFERATWSVPTLRLIAARPGTVSTELAMRMGLERLPFKQRVRRLKAFGLTESLDVGYRLSPRGRAVLAALAAGDPARQGADPALTPSKGSERDGGARVGKNLPRETERSKDLHDDRQGGGNGAPRPPTESTP